MEAGGLDDQAAVEELHMTRLTARDVEGGSSEQQVGAAVCFGRLGGMVLTVVALHYGVAMVGLCRTQLHPVSRRCLRQGSLKPHEGFCGQWRAGLIKHRQQELAVFPCRPPGETI